MTKKTLIAAGLLALAVVMAGCSAEYPGLKNPPADTQKAAAPKAPAIAQESLAHSDAGIKKYQNGDYAGAIAEFDQALEIDKYNYQALSNKGVTLAMQGNQTGNKETIRDGIGLIQQALQIYPDDVSSFYNLALALKIDGKYTVAITYFKKVLAADPNNTWSYYGIATIYGDEGKAPEANEYLKKAIDLGGEDVKEAARSQSHFDKIRSDADFQALVK